MDLAHSAPPKKPTLQILKNFKVEFAASKSIVFSTYKWTDKTKKNF